MDVAAIPPGEVWPNRLRSALDRATIVVVVIGPAWLRSADSFGRRRLDAPNDWVRLEIEYALKNRKTVIPLLIGGERELPLEGALPASISDLRKYQATIINDASWEDDVSSLARRLVESYGLKELQTDVVFPMPEVVVTPLSEEELSKALELLPGWEPVESSSPRDYPCMRHELRRGYRFTKFKNAIDFLQLIVEPINKLKHHPRIENQWRTVFIYFTTWDIGKRITSLDIEAAKAVEQVYKACEK